MLCYKGKLGYYIKCTTIYLPICLYKIILTSINTFISISMRQIAVDMSTNARRL